MESALFTTLHGPPATPPAMAFGSAAAACREDGAPARRTAVDPAGGVAAGQVPPRGP
ncbi:hypothetical protein [Streptomyces sediminimaris]|uniref:hypothetical protein n=1 Tax=Streptomyces sediminimaris TaxID=3383721 RepID=UPI003999D286